MNFGIKFSRTLADREALEWAKSVKSGKMGFSPPQLQRQDDGVKNLKINQIRMFGLSGVMTWSLAASLLSAAVPSVADVTPRLPQPLPISLS